MLRGPNTYLIFVCAKQSACESIWYSYLVESYYEDILFCTCCPTGNGKLLWWSKSFWRSYIFDLRFWPDCYKQKYSIFVFGQVLRNKYNLYSCSARLLGTKYIRYSYSVRCLDMNIFYFHIRWLFYEYIRIHIWSGIYHPCYTL